MNPTTTLRNLLDVCVKRCKAADKFRDGVYEVAQMAVNNPEHARETLVTICQMCDPKYVAPVEAKKAEVVGDVLGLLGNNRGPGSPAAPTAEGEAKDQQAPNTTSVVRNV